METNDRLVINDCASKIFDGFISRINTNKEIVFRWHKPATEETPQQRYSYSSSYEHISIVYETKSRTLIITAPEHIILLLKDEYNYSKNSVALPAKAEKQVERQAVKPVKESAGQETMQAVKVKRTPAPARAASVRAAKPDKPLALEQKEQPPAAVIPKGKSIDISKEKIAVSSKEKFLDANVKGAVVSNGKGVDVRSGNAVFSKDKGTDITDGKDANKKGAIVAKDKKDKIIQSKALVKNTEIAETATGADLLTPAAKNTDSEETQKTDFVVKKVTTEKLEGFLKKIKTFKGVTYRLQEGVGDSPDAKAYVVRDSKNKVYLRFQPQKQLLQIQGKRSSLLSDVQVLASQDSDYMTAVSSHIQVAGEEKKAKDMEKKLKKLFPNAFDFLSEQSRIDFTIGMIDIGNDEVRLSDYSMLLVPPYRGLERFIFDLQRAQGLEVKMIGQAYEKTDGKYVLKLGYRRRIPSVIYAEVMSALYTEYFEKRNFYAHSDITGDLLSRVITDKQTVKTIFAGLSELIEYNVKKLKEIGFTLK